MGESWLCLHRMVNHCEHLQEKLFIVCNVDTKDAEHPPDVFKQRFINLSCLPDALWALVREVLKFTSFSQLELSSAESV